MAATAKTAEHTLEKETELRFEAQAEHVKLRLLSGTAEIFGTELVKDRDYTFVLTHVSVFTWSGARVSLSGSFVGSYTAKETPMLSYLNTHAAIDRRRQQAAVENQRGPRVMIVGPPNVGKSTLAKMLASYAARTGRRPLYIDLDVGEGAAAIPGAFTAVSIDRPVDVESGFLSFNPVCYHYGDVEIGKSFRHFCAVVD